MKKWIVIIVSLLSLIVAALFVAPKANQGVTFSGTIKEIKNGCWADGICSIRVDDNWVVAEIGGRTLPGTKPLPRGSLIGINFSSDTIMFLNKRVEVYAGKESGGYTIYGNSKFYIKILE